MDSRGTFLVVGIAGIASPLLLTWKLLALRKSIALITARVNVSSKWRWKVMSYAVAKLSNTTEQLFLMLPLVGPRSVRVIYTSTV